jgi:hypothetical protein
MCPLDRTLRIPELPVRRGGIQRLQGTDIATHQKRLPPASPRPARLATAAGLSLDRTGNGRPRDLVKRWGRPWVVPFPKQKCRQAKLAGVKVGRSSIASPSNTSACNLPPRGPTDLSHAGTAIDSFRQSASCQFAASTLKRGGRISREDPHEKHDCQRGNSQRYSDGGDDP